MYIYYHYATVINFLYIYDHIKNIINVIVYLALHNYIM